MTREQAYRIRKLIENAVKTLTDEDALDCAMLYEHWKTAIGYAIGDRVYYDGTLYKCVQAHTSIDEWTPDVAVSLWAKVLIPEPTVIPEWEQPSSTNPYMRGDKVRHLEKIWESMIDYNVYEPSTVPDTIWKEVEE